MCDGRICGRDKEAARALWFQRGGLCWYTVPAPYEWCRGLYHDLPRARSWCWMR